MNIAAKTKKLHNNRRDELRNRASVISCVCFKFMKHTNCVEDLNKRREFDHKVTFVHSGTPHRDLDSIRKLLALLSFHILDYLANYDHTLWYFAKLEH